MNWLRYVLAGVMVVIFAAWMVTLGEEVWKRLRGMLLLLLLCAAPMMAQTHEGWWERPPVGSYGDSVAHEVLMLVTVTPTSSAQDSPSALDQRWREAGTEPVVHPYPLATVYAIAPHPGYWHCATAGNFRYCPCPGQPGNDPYVQWQDPETFNIGYFRYDFSPYLYTGHSACGIVPAPCIDGQGGPNHTQQGYGFPLNYLVPLEPQPDVNNYYPVPEAATGLGAIWAQFNTPPPAFPGTNYSQKMKSNPVWVTAYNYKKPVMDADPGCSSSAPTPTKTPTPGPTLTPSKTPTPTVNIYAAWIEAAVSAQYMSACGPQLFCPGDATQIGQGYVTRSQEAVFILKSVHGAAWLPPACVGVFKDVPCAH